MTARRAIAASIVAAAMLAAQARQEADPHELYERATEHLEQGRLQDSCAASTRLRELVAARSEWDPDGAFRRDLLPPLEARQKRLLSAARALDQFHDRSLEELRPPDLSSEISTVRDYTHWATTVVQRLRKERDTLVEGILTDPADAAILARTESWARSERLLEVEVLKTMAEKAGDDVLGLLSGDAQLESVLVRFRQLKKDLIQAMVERDRFQAQIKEAEERRQALAAAVAAAVLEMEGPKKGRRDEATGVQARFAQLLKSEREALQKRPSVTPAEQAALEERVDRLRLANKVLTASGNIRSQKRAVEEVALALAALPVRNAPPAAAPGGFGWMGWILPALLGAMAGVGAQIILRHRRRPVARRGDETQPEWLTDEDARDADGRRDAA